MTAQPGKDAISSSSPNPLSPQKAAAVSEGEASAVAGVGLGVHIVARSHAGRVRPNNEDAVGFVAPEGIAVLADGMGGLNAGEVASQQAVDLMVQGLTAGLSMEQAAMDANRAIFERSRNDPELQGMGTTLVALRCVDSRLWLANVGDSRIYRYRASTLVQLTKDHSVVQQMIDSGVLSATEARVASNRNIITRALGIDGDVEVDVSRETPVPDDLYMLCSDGVTDMLPPEDLEGLFHGYQAQLAARPASAPMACADLVDAIVQAANDAGGVDNISVVLVHVVTRDQQMDNHQTHKQQSQTATRSA